MPFARSSRSRGLTLVIVASLAIGIGANSAVFSIVNAILIKPFPYPDPERLAVLWLRSPGINTTDPLTFLAVLLLLVVTAVLASYVPARRATRVDPVVVLRDE